jgi:hypothetical protein
VLEWRDSDADLRIEHCHFGGAKHARVAERGQGTENVGFYKPRVRCRTIRIGSFGEKVCL